MVIELAGLRRGQNTVEYMLYISVIVISLCYVAWIFLGDFSSGVQALNADASSLFQSGMESGSGDTR